MNPNTIVNIAQDLLSAAVDAYGEPDTPDPPARTFLTHGTPLVEGEQLTVVCTSLRATAPFPLTKLTAPKSTITPGADFAIEVWRSCWPAARASAAGSQLQDPSAMQAAAVLLHQDLATITAYVATLGVVGKLLPSQPTLGTAQDVAFGTWTPLGPQGLLAGWRWPVQVKLP